MSPVPDRVDVSRSCTVKSTAVPSGAHTGVPWRLSTAAPRSRRPVPSAFMTQTCVSSIVISTIGQPSSSGLERQHAAVGRPTRVVFVALRSTETPEGFVRQLHRVDVVVEELIVVGVSIREVHELCAVRRPIDRVLVEESVRELLDATGCDVDENRCIPALSLKRVSPSEASGLYR